MESTKKLLTKEFKGEDPGVEIFIPTPLGDVINAVLDERNKQHAKWGEQNHASGTWLEILQEEIGEYSEAQLHTRFGGPKAENVRHELIQVAAVAIAMLECYDRNKMVGGSLAETGGITSEMKAALVRVVEEAYFGEGKGGATVSDMDEIVKFFKLESRI